MWSGSQSAVSKARFAEVEGLFERVGQREASRLAEEEASPLDTVRSVRAHAARSSKHLKANQEWKEQRQWLVSYAPRI